MAVFADGKIEAYVGPPALGAADDLEQVIVDFIGGARSRLDIAVQELDSEPIARALLDASWRGVRVTLFLEQDYVRTSLTRDTTGVPVAPTPQPGETPEQALERVQWGPDETELRENRRILSALLRSDVETRGDFNPKIFHQKFILRDYHDGKATDPGDPALLVALARGGMAVRGVLDPEQAAHEWAAPKTMKPPIQLFVPRKTGAFQDLRKLHHKLMVIDERVVVAGSFNYTQPANEYNDENIFVLGSVFPKTPDGTDVDAARCKALAKHLKAEIERIIANSKTYVP